MASILRRFILRPISNLFEDADVFLTKLRAKALKRYLLSGATDKLLELMLGVMDLSFYLFKDDDYQKHLKDSEGRYFEGRYLFQTAGEKKIIAAATFKNGEMHVRHDVIHDWDVKVTFEDGKALRKFLFSKDPDVLNSLAENKMEVDGNLNYIFKFGYMARDLFKRIDLTLGNV